jgi:hypothetical protein
MALQSSTHSSSAWFNVRAGAVVLKSGPRFRWCGLRVAAPDLSHVAKTLRRAD